jgi:hypothetical protein
MPNAKDTYSQENDEDKKALEIWRNPENYLNSTNAQGSGQPLSYLREDRANGNQDENPPIPYTLRRTPADNNRQWIAGGEGTPADNRNSNLANSNQPQTSPIPENKQISENEIPGLTADYGANINLPRQEKSAENPSIDSEHLSGNDISWLIRRAELAKGNSKTSQPEEPTFYLSKAPEPSSFLRRAVIDQDVSLLKGIAVGIPQVGIGIADLFTKGKAGKEADKILHNITGRDFKEAGEYFDEHLSPETRLAKEKIKKSVGFTNTIGTAIKNPSGIISEIEEEVPSMFGGGKMGTKFMKGIGKPVTEEGLTLANKGRRAIAAGAIGDALISTGKNNEELRKETKDGTLTTEQLKLMSAGGIADLLLSLGSKYVTGGLLPDAAKKGMAKYAGGFVKDAAEGTLKATGDQVLKNSAMDRPVNDGVDEAAARGSLTGGGKGMIKDSFGPFRRRKY